ncbi:RHS repeat-associated core domain-containing protein [Pseudomonas sp. NPDC087029]|uniref:RHS repeat-associated core domain-containing protein n=1 Tax=Pseudomonas sp. NPDC087029 TaxID=3364433 RepID=UPI003800681E
MDSNSNLKAAKIVGCEHSSTVLSTQQYDSVHLLTYTPYGCMGAHHWARSVLLFNGERKDEASQGYLLGNGVRNFSPQIMRFCAPDNLSPFSDGGINAYAYCGGDPINRYDPSGHAYIAYMKQQAVKVPSLRRRIIGRPSGTRAVDSATRNLLRVKLTPSRNKTLPPVRAYEHTLDAVVAPPRADSPHWDAFKALHNWHSIGSGKRNKVVKTLVDFQQVKASGREERLVRKSMQEYIQFRLNHDGVTFSEWSTEVVALSSSAMKDHVTSIRRA